VDRLPPFSGSLGQILALTAKENVQIHQLAGVIERDALLSAHILRVVNSAAFSVRREIGSIAQACNLLGVFRLRNLALAVSVAGHWKSFSLPKFWSQKRFNLHAAAVALLADRMSLFSDAEHGEVCFLAGLLHDLGKLVMVSAHPQAFEALTLYAAKEQVPATMFEREFYGIDHAELASVALDRWKIAAPVRDTVRFHHMPDHVPGLWKARKTVHSVHLLAEADRYVNQVGLGVLPAMGETNWEPLPAVPGASALSTQEIARMVEEFKQDLTALELVI
jgi:HD-like signal output (HDOD) protein